MEMCASLCIFNKLCKWSKWLYWKAGECGIEVFFVVCSLEMNNIRSQFLKIFILQAKPLRKKYLATDL